MSGNENATVLSLLAENDRLRSELEAERERRKGAEEALMPFAREADQWADSVPDGHRSLCTEPGGERAIFGSETEFTIGDLRAARAHFQSQEARNGE